MSKDWIVLTSRSGIKRYVQVKHISSFGKHQDRRSLRAPGDTERWPVHERPVLLNVVYKTRTWGVKSSPSR